MSPTEHDREILERVKRAVDEGRVTHELMRSAMMECSDDGKRWLADELGKLPQPPLPNR